MNYFWKIWKKSCQKLLEPYTWSVCYPNTSWYMVFDPIFDENAPSFVKTVIFIIFKNPHFWLFSGVLEVKLKFVDKFYNIIDYNKCPSSEKEDEKCIFRKSYFHRIQPRHIWRTSGFAEFFFVQNYPPPALQKPFLQIQRVPSLDLKKYFFLNRPKSYF